MSELGPLGAAPASVASLGGWEPTSPLQTATSQALDRMTVEERPVTMRVVNAPDAPPINKSLPGNLRALTRKYQELSPFINELPPEARNALIELDAQRVSSGGKPLTREETIKAAQTWVDQRPATPAPDRSLANVPGNFLSDLGAIVKSIPQIPAGIARELDAIGTSEEGANFFQQPGVRLLPGAFIAGNVMDGTEGLRELATHPLFTVLDALPFASKAAEGTRAGQLAMEAAEQSGRSARPLAAALTQRVEDGALVDRAPRRMLKEFRDSTRIGQQVDRALGARSRDVSRTFEDARMQVVNWMNGIERSDDLVVDATQRAVKLNERYFTEHGWDQERVAAVTAKMKTGNLADFDPIELNYRNEFNELTDVVGNEMVREGLMTKFAGEFYPLSQGNELQQFERRASHYQRTVALRDEWRSTGRPRFNADDIDEFISDALNRRTPGTAAATNFQVSEFRAIVNMMERYGYDVVEARSLLGKTKQRGIEPVADALRRTIERTDPAGLRPLPSASDITRALEASAKAAGKANDVQVKRLIEAIAKGDSQEITRRLTNILKRKAKRDDLFPGTLIDDIRKLRTQYADDRWLSRYTRRRSDLALQSYQTKLQSTPPARFGPVIGERTRQGIDIDVRDATRPGTWRKVKTEGANATFVRMEEQALGRKLTPDEITEVARLVKEERWGKFRFGDHDTVADLYRDIEKEVARTWLELRRQGVEPSFIHVTSPNRVRATLSPQVGPVPVGLSQTQERMIDMSPGIEDAGVAVSHQGMEILSRRASEEALDHVLQQYGIPERQLREMYATPARALDEADPLWGFTGQLRQLIERKYVAVDLKDIGFDWKSARLSKYEQNRVFVPRALHDVLGDIAKAPRLGPLMDGPTKVFRMAVVGLSPRTVLYNMLGGATMLLGETGPRGFRYFQQAREWTKNPELITADSLRRVIGSERQIMRDFDDILDVSTRQRKAEMMATVAGGRTLGRLWDSMRQSKVTQGLGTAVDKLYDLNAMVDDMYRVMGYLHGYDKSLTKGLSREAAERAGLETMQKVMMDWGSMTPIERGILKSIFPFYSFMNHSIRYVARYPVDHPLRAGMLAAFGRAQQEDLDGLFPDRWLSFFTFGDVDSGGNQNALSLASVNPFGDVANMLTFTGFLSATNPVILTALESVGLVQGAAELYPTLRYDPETGRLTGDRSNPLINFATNVVPQTDILFSLAGANAQFNDQLNRDPAAAWRTLASAGGMPVVWRNLEVVEEVYRSELARQDSQAAVLNQALKSGQWGEANRYPGIREQGIQSAIGNLPPEVIASFTSPEQDAIRGQLEALLAGQQPTWEPPDGYEELMTATIDPQQATVANQRALGGI
jgi:hypothetical protein